VSRVAAASREAVPTAASTEPLGSSETAARARPLPRAHVASPWLTYPEAAAYWRQRTESRLPSLSRVGASETVGSSRQQRQRLR
jgi:hypothetical protein